MSERVALLPVLAAEIATLLGYEYRNSQHLEPAIWKLIQRMMDPTPAMLDALYAEGRAIMRELGEITDESDLDFLERSAFEHVMLRYWRVMLRATAER
jgi:hypothetical protein